MMVSRDQAPFLDLLDARCASAGDGVATLTLDLGGALCNRHGAAHAAVVMGLLERAMAHAAASRADGAREAEAIDLHFGFMRAVSGRIVATARTTGGGRSVCFCEAEIADAGGAVVAKAMGTFRTRAPTPAPT